MTSLRTLCTTGLVLVCACRAAERIPEEATRSDAPNGDRSRVTSPRDLSNCQYRTDAPLHASPELSVKAYECPDAAVFLLEELTRADEGQSSRVVRAQITAAPLTADEQFATVYCSLATVMDEYIVAIARSADAPRLDDIRAAWRVDSSTKKFTELHAEDVTCGNEAYGV